MNMFGLLPAMKCFGVKGLRSLSTNVRGVKSVRSFLPILDKSAFTSRIAQENHLWQPSLVKFDTLEWLIKTPRIEDNVDTETNTMLLDSVLRKRRLKMKKHKLRKRRKEQRALKKRLGKI